MQYVRFKTRVCARGTVGNDQHKHRSSESFAGGVDQETGLSETSFAVQS